MAKINVTANISAPEEVNVVLVRSDHLEVQNIFRVFFEIFLSLTSTILGFVLSVDKKEAIHWVVLVGCGVFTITFLILSMTFARRRTSTKSPATKV